MAFETGREFQERRTQTILTNLASRVRGATTVGEVARDVARAIETIQKVLPGYVPPTVAEPEPPTRRSCDCGADAEDRHYAEMLLNHVPRDMWPALGITPFSASASTTP